MGLLEELDGMTARQMAEAIGRIRAVRDECDGYEATVKAELLETLHLHSARLGSVKGQPIKTPDVEVTYYNGPDSPSGVVTDEWAFAEWVAERYPSEVTYTVELSREEYLELRDRLPRRPKAEVRKTTKDKLAKQVRRLDDGGLVMATRDGEPIEGMAPACKELGIRVVATADGKERFRRELHTMMPSLAGGIVQAPKEIEQGRPHLEVVGQ